MKKLSFFSVNQDIEKSYDSSFDEQVLKEWEMPIYNPNLQKNNYCETSVYFHLAANSNALVEPYDYIGCFQYDMKLRQETFDTITRVLSKEFPGDKNIVFYFDKQIAYNLLGSSVVGAFGEECLSHNGYKQILERYNEMFGTAHEYNNIVYEDIFQYHAFLLHKEQFYKVVRFIVSIVPFIINILTPLAGAKHIPYTFDTIWGFVLMLQKRENPQMKWVRLPGIDHRSDIKDHAWKDSVNPKSEGIRINETSPLTVIKKNLVFMAVFHNPDYINLLQLLLQSIKANACLDSNTDILVMTSEAFQPLVSELAKSLGIHINLYILDLKTLMDACCARLHIFDYTFIDRYENILYLDTDILINSNLNVLFNLPIDSDKLYALEEGTIGHVHWGSQFFDFDKISKDVTGFSTGVLYFRSSQPIRELFEAVNAHIRTHTTEIPCFEQPFLVYRAIMQEKYDNTFLKTFVENNPTTVESKKIIYHFPVWVGDYASKYEKIADFSNNYNYDTSFIIDNTKFADLYFKQIYVILLCYNEEVLLPHTIAHYRKYLPSCQIIIIDNESTDNSLHIALHLGCKVTIVNTNNIMNEHMQTNMKNGFWKAANLNTFYAKEISYAERAWVIMGDMDEWLCVTEEELKREEDAGTTVLTVEGRDMIGHSSATNLADIDLHAIDKYVINESESKNLCFLRGKIEEMNYTSGAYSCNPVGTVQYSSNKYINKHMNWLGIPYAIHKNINRYNRTHDMRAAGQGTHYTDNIEIIVDRYNTLLHKSKN